MKSTHRITWRWSRIGAGLLWLGWNGFNGGDPYNAGVDAAAAVLNTNLATAVAFLVWVTWDDPTGAQAVADRERERHDRRARTRVRVRLSPQMMIAHHVAVVGEEHDQRLLHEPAPVQRFQDAPDLLVHET